MYLRLLRGSATPIHSYRQHNSLKAVSKTTKRPQNCQKTKPRMPMCKFRKLHDSYPSRPRNFPFPSHLFLLSLIASKPSQNQERRRRRRRSEKEGRRALHCTAQVSSIYQHPHSNTYSAMFRISNGLIGLLNILTTLISIPIMAWALFSRFHGDTECHRFLNMPLFYFGVFLLIVSLIGLLGSCCRVTFFMWIYLFVMFVLIVVLIAFTIFAFIITNKGAGEVVSGKGYKEYHLGDYSNWLQKRVGNPKTWAKIKSCLTDARVCNALGDGVVSQTASAFYEQHLSPIMVRFLSLLHEIVLRNFAP